MWPKVRPAGPPAVSGNRRPSRWGAACITLVVVVASCASSEPDTTGDTEPSPTTTPATTTDGDETGGTAPDPAAAGGDSFRGVTADSIKVGVTVPDFDALQAAGIPNYQGSNEIAFGAFIDAINEAGGIGGRTIEPVFVDFSFLDPISQDQACIELTEDHEVFIVLYGLLSEANLCFSDLHDTLVMTDQFQTTDLQERSGDAAWLQLRAADDAQIAILGSVIAESGRLDGKTIGIVANGALNNGIDGELLQEQLTGLGYDARVVVTTPGLTDIQQQEAEYRIFAERLTADGVDFVFNLLGGGNTADVFAAAGFEPEFAYSVLTSSVDGAQDPSLLDGAVSVAPRPDEVFWDDPEFRTTCVDPILERNPELAAELAEIPTGEEQAAGETSWLNPTRIACNQLMLLTELVEIAGADLTNDSFTAALDELGPIDFHGYGRATFTSAGKWDGLDEFYVQEYDAAADVIRVVGDPIVVDR